MACKREEVGRIGEFRISTSIDFYMVGARDQALAEESESSPRVTFISKALTFKRVEKDFQTVVWLDFPYRVQAVVFMLAKLRIFSEFIKGILSALPE